MRPLPFPPPRPAPLGLRNRTPARTPSRAPSLVLSLALAFGLPILGGGMPAPVLAQDAAAPGERRGMLPEDYHRLAFLADPRISPDGAEVAFVVRRVSEDLRGRDGAIWLAPVEGAGEPRQLTAGNRDAMPRWAPNGLRLAYLDRGPDPAAEDEDADPGVRLRILPREGGEASTVLHLRQGDIADFTWTRDGRIVLTLDLDPSVDDPRQPAPPRDPSAPDLTVVTDAVYQAGTGLIGPERQHLWILDPTVGALSRLTPGDPRWNDRNAAVSPDGRTVVFQRDGSGEEYDGAFPRDLWLLPLDAPPGTEPLPLGLPVGRAERPAWAPDNRTLLYRFQPGRYARAHLQLVDRRVAEEPVGSPRTLTLDADLDPAQFFWHPSGRHLYFTADHRGTHPLYRVNANGSDVRPLFGEDGVVASPTLSADGSRLAFLYENEVNPPEVWVAEEDGRNPRPLTAFNRALLESLDLVRAEEFDFLNGEGDLLQGFLVRPVGWTAGEATYPMVLNIKGGPGGMWGRRWFPEFQIMAAAGYAVAFVNYRGSSGYGHAFQSAVRQDYGGADARDNLRLVDETLSRNAWIDRERLFITGGSHGGFLTNWITTETPRFRAAVTQRSVANWISEAGTQAYPPRAMREEFGGTIWENYPLYWERSPLSRADRVQTPTLVIHSDRDVITPLGQGQEWYFALKALGVPTEMVIFHGEGHELSRSGKPVNLVERLRRILEWFERWDTP
jgi:dipeptidyl aminopeptidase/acylaminoacyl peptidase